MASALHMPTIAAAHPERGLARAGDVVFRVKQTELVLTSPGQGTGPSAHSPQLSSRFDGPVVVRLAEMAI